MFLVKCADELSSRLLFYVFLILWLVLSLSLSLFCKFIFTLMIFYIFS